MQTFADQYKDFLSWYSGNEAAVDSGAAEREVAYVNELVSSITQYKS